MVSYTHWRNAKDVERHFLKQATVNIEDIVLLHARMKLLEKALVDQSKGEGQVIARI